MTQVGEEQLALVAQVALWLARGDISAFVDIHLLLETYSLISTGVGSGSYISTPGTRVYIISDILHRLISGTCINCLVHGVIQLLNGMTRLINGCGAWPLISRVMPLINRLVRLISRLMLVINRVTALTI